MREHRAGPDRHGRRPRGRQRQRPRRHPHRDQGRAPHPPHPAPDLPRGHAAVEPAAPARGAPRPRHHPGDLQVRVRGRHPDPRQDELRAHPRRPRRRARWPRPSCCAASAISCGWPTQTNTRFSREISDRVRVVACLTKLPNIIHSDSLSETLSSSRWDSVRKAVRATADDTGGRRLGAGRGRPDGRPGDRHPGQRSRGRHPVRDAPGPARRHERLRAHPARPGPDVPRHRPAAQAGHRGAPRGHPPAPARAGLDARSLVPRARPARRTSSRSSRVSRFAGLFEILVKEWRIDPGGRGRGPRPVPQAAETQGARPGRSDRGGPPPHLRPVPRPEDLPRRRVGPDGAGRPRRASARDGRGPAGDRGGDLRPGRRVERPARGR
ncbi:MAG: hypothetical protein MZU84_01820 [Sphingobacterium sp.]|nr:hypothetical protein [Sphingobacterium sp.]